MLEDDDVKQCAGANGHIPHGYAPLKGGVVVAEDP